MDGLDYIRDDHYFDKWDDTLKCEYFGIEDFHAGLIYNAGEYSFVYTREYNTTSPDREIVPATWYEVIIMGIETNCLDDILVDFPDLANRIKNTTAKDYENFYRITRELE